MRDNKFFNLNCILCNSFFLKRNLTRPLNNNLSIDVFNIITNVKLLILNRKRLTQLSESDYNQTIKFEHSNDILIFLSFSHKVSANK